MTTYAPSDSTATISAVTAMTASVLVWSSVKPSRPEPGDRLEREGAADVEAEHAVDADPAVAAVEVEVVVDVGAHEHAGGADEHHHPARARSCTFSVPCMYWWMSQM